MRARDRSSDAVQPGAPEKVAQERAEPRRASLPVLQQGYPPHRHRHCLAYSGKRSGSTLLLQFSLLLCLMYSRANIPFLESGADAFVYSRKLFVFRLRGADKPREQTSRAEDIPAYIMCVFLTVCVVLRTFL